MNVTLDAIDLRILDLLQGDGSLSVADVADHLGMTPPPCWRRVKRLKDIGVLRRQVWEVDAQVVGLNLFVYASIRLSTHDPDATRAFREAVQSLPEVLECHILLGSIDALLKIVATDIQHYETFFYERLSQLPGVREVNSSVLMSEVKNTTRLPLHLAADRG